MSKVPKSAPSLRERAKRERVRKCAGEHGMGVGAVVVAVVVAVNAFLVVVMCESHEHLQSYNENVYVPQWASV